MVTVTVSAPLDAALHLDEAQPPGARHAALDVVAELLELAVGRLEAERALDLHHDGAGARGGGLRVDRRERLRRAAGRSSRASRPSGHDDQPAEHHRRQRRDLRLASSSSRRFCSRACRSSARRRASCELSRAPALPACSWSLSCSARWSQ